MATPPLDPHKRKMQVMTQLEVFKLGNYLVWLAPNGAALVIDLNDGKDKLSDTEIDKLFVAKK